MRDCDVFISFLMSLSLIHTHTNTHARTLTSAHTQITMAGIMYRLELMTSTCLLQPMHSYCTKKKRKCFAAIKALFTAGFHVVMIYLLPDSSLQRCTSYRFLCQLVALLRALPSTFQELLKTPLCFSAWSLVYGVRFFFNPKCGRSF